MASDSGMYKTLLHLVSASAHEIVTRKKLSRQYRDAASTVADALKLLLAGQDDLPAVKRLLDQADAGLSRASDDLDKARAMLDDALTDSPKSAGTGAKTRTPSSKVIGKKTAAKKTAAKKKAAGRKTAVEAQVATKGSTAKKATSKKTASKKVASKTPTGKKIAARKVTVRSKATGKKRTARS